MSQSGFIRRNKIIIASEFINWSRFLKQRKFIAILIMVLVFFTACTLKDQGTAGRGSDSSNHRTEKVTVTGNTTPLALGTRPLWSPDGQKVAWLLHGSLVIGAVQDQKVATKSQANNLITVVHVAADLAPDKRLGEFQWSSDGQRLAYTIETSRRKAEPQLYIYDTITGRNQNLFSAEPGKYQTFYNLNWVKDNRLFFWANSLGATRPFLANVATGGITEVTNGGEMISVAPDGEKIAYLSEEEEGLRIFIGDSQGNNRRSIATLMGTDAFIMHMTWSPDANKLALWADGSVLLVDAMGNNPIRKTTYPEPGVYPEEVQWSKDGGKIIVATLDNIYFGSISQEKLTPLKDGAVFASWSPDGNSILFQRKGQGEAWEIGIKGKTQVSLLSNVDGQPLNGSQGMKGSEEKDADEYNTNAQDMRNSGATDGVITLPKGSVQEKNLETPLGIRVIKELEQYFLGQQWQGYAMLDRLYNTGDGRLYAVTIVYYLENDAYYPEAYEVILQKINTDSVKVQAYEVMPFSDGFEP